MTNEDRSFKTFSDLAAALVARGLFDRMTGGLPAGPDCYEIG